MSLQNLFGYLQEVFMLFQFLILIRRDATDNRGSADGGAITNEKKLDEEKPSIKENFYVREMYQRRWHVVKEAHEFGELPPKLKKNEKVSTSVKLLRDGLYSLIEKEKIEEFEIDNDVDKNDLNPI